MNSPNDAPRARLATLDGLRGIAIVLVVLSHSWQLFSPAFFDEHLVVRPLVRSGDTAVTVFLVVAGYLTYQALAGRRGLTAMRPGVTFVRRVARVAPSLWLMLAVLMLVALVDPTDKTRWSDNLDSVGHVLTYTWNWYVQGNLITSRPDFGHLWYLSVDMQAFVIVAALLYLMRRRPVGLVFLLGGFFLLLTWWRFHVTATESVFQVLVRTTARMDAFVLGALVAALVPLLARLPIAKADLTRTVVASGLLLVPISYWTANNQNGDGDHQFLTWGGTVLQLDLAVLVGAIALGAGPSFVTRALERPRLVFLGENSLLLYIWHYPLFLLVARHTDGWPWPLRVLLTAVLVVGVCVAAHRLLERRVTAFLRRPFWRRLDDGFIAPLGRLARRRLPEPLTRPFVDEQPAVRDSAQA